VEKKVQPATKEVLGTRKNKATGSQKPSVRRKKKRGREKRVKTEGTEQSREKKVGKVGAQVRMSRAGGWKWGDKAHEKSSLKTKEGSE